MHLRGRRPLSVTTLRAVATIGLVAGLLAGCGGPAPDLPVAAAQPSTSPAPAEYEAPAGDAADVERAFRDYNQALLARDFATACDLTSSTAVKKLVAAVKKQGGKATTCEQAFRVLYGGAAGAGADAVSRAIRVTGVRLVDDVGRVDWSVASADGGAPRSSTAEFRKVDGTWKLLPAS